MRASEDRPTTIKLVQLSDLAWTTRCRRGRAIERSMSPINIERGGRGDVASRRERRPARSSVIWSGS